MSPSQLADRVSHVRVLECPPGIVRFPVERDHAVLRVPARAIDAAPVEHRDVGVGVEDSRRWPLPRNTEREAGHDRVVSVGPLIELDHLVPVLGLVDRHAHIEPCCRHEHPVSALVGPLHTVLRLEWRAPPEHAAHGRTRGAGTRKTQASSPGASQVRLPVGQPGRRRRRWVSCRSPAAASTLSKPALRDQGRTDDGKECHRAREKPRSGDSLEGTPPRRSGRQRVHRRFLTFQPSAHSPARA